MVVKAGQPEILRAAQVDEAFQKNLSDLVSEILQSVGGIHYWMKYKESAKLLTRILYQMMTTLSNLQTLGEEYTGMVQVNSSGTSLPKKHMQLLYILMNNCGEKLLIQSLAKFKKNIENLPKEHPLQLSARVELIKLAHTLKLCLPILVKFHKALFYLYGDYYEIGKRLCGIRYILIRYWLKNKSSLPGFKLLGIVSIVHLTINLLLTVISYKNMNVEEENFSKGTQKSVDSSDKCSLCLNVRQHTSITPCGHMFCWSCIIQWLQEQPKCPLCRQIFQPTRVVFLQNYSNVT